jgi:hypothetical protein
MCTPQVSKPGSRACQACFTSKQRCSWGEDAGAPAAAGVKEPAVPVVAPRGRSRGGAGDTQLRIAKAAEDSALAHKKSAEELARTAVAAERAALALEGIQMSLRDIGLAATSRPPVGSRPSAVPRPNIVISRPPIRPSRDVLVHAPVRAAQASSSSAVDRSSAARSESRPAKRGRPAPEEPEEEESSSSEAGDSDVEMETE